MISLDREGGLHAKANQEAEWESPGGVLSKREDLERTVKEFERGSIVECLRRLAAGSTSTFRKRIGSSLCFAGVTGALKTLTT